MNARTAINWLLALVMLLFVASLATLQIESSRRSAAAEMEAATRVTLQLLVSLISNEQARQGEATPAALADFLQAAGRIRAHDITVWDANGQILHRSPPSEWKAGRNAPKWFERWVAPGSEPVTLSLGSGTLRVTPDDSRMVLDAWDELMNLFWLSVILFALLNLLVFWFAGKAWRENHRWMQLIQLHIEEERRNIAHELHDEIGQSLTAIKSMAKSLVNRTPESKTDSTNTAQAIIDVSSGMYDAMHGMVRRLRPLVLDKLGLQAALQELVESQRVRHPAINFSLSLKGDFAEVGPEVAIAAYRMVQESLTNVVRHANATEAIVIADVDTRLILSVTDNGQGVRSHPDGRSERLGLIGMRERIESLGGSFSWHDDNGVHIQVSLPLRSAGVAP